ncbi:hypothetical protein NLG97_g2322 [Lecanicillium saksenae]|uniref:Uncharacterized protein n=1 Tax=Lecanicillium saksenae TaxID=468837 RepID=A0ACC1R3W1_9HYPO|nr:hypothetical protein NLG97_g2322 [Lecanicillium saksenae]
MLGGNFEEKILIGNKPSHFRAFHDTRTEGNSKEYVRLRDQKICDGEILVFIYSVTSEASFNYIQTEIEAVLKKYASASSEIPFSTPAITQPPPPMVLIGNKSDWEKERKVKTSEGLDFARKHHCIFVETPAGLAFGRKLHCDFSEASLKADKSMQKFFQFVTDNIRRQPVEESSETSGSNVPGHNLPQFCLTGRDTQTEEHTAHDWKFQDLIKGVAALASCFVPRPRSGAHSKLIGYNGHLRLDRGQPSGLASLVGHTSQCSNYPQMAAQSPAVTYESSGG